MQIARSAKNKMGFIDGSIKQPSLTAEPIVLSWIVNTLERDLSGSVLFTNVAAEIWADLEERFAQSNVPRIFQIERDIATLMQDQMSVSAYYSKLKGY